MNSKYKETVLDLRSRFISIHIIFVRVPTIPAINPSYIEDI